MTSLGGHVQKSFLLGLFILSLTISTLTSKSYAAANYNVVPQVKEVLATYAVKSSNMTEAYAKIKTISLSAIDYIQTDGEKSSEELDILVGDISRRLERDAVFMSKDQIIATIISAINS